MKLKTIVPVAVLMLAACDALPPPDSRRPLVVGQTTEGAPVYRFQLTRTNALGVTPVSDSAIAARALQICPGGYVELARSGEATRRISGVIYTDVFVTVVCS